MQVRQAQVRPAVDVLLALSAVEVHRHGEAGTGRLDVCGRFGLSLVQVVPVFVRIGLQLFVRTDLFGQVGQGSVCRAQVRVALKQAENEIFHGI